MIPKLELQRLDAAVATELSQYDPHPSLASVQRIFRCRDFSSYCVAMTKVDSLVGIEKLEQLDIRDYLYVNIEREMESRDEDFYYVDLLVAVHLWNSARLN